MWGSKKYHKQEMIHHRAMRTFLGVGKKTPIPGLYGEMGWRSLTYYRRQEMVRYWLKIYNMNNRRLAKQTFIWDYQRALAGRKGWNKEIKEILRTADLEDAFYGLGIEHPKHIMSKLTENIGSSEDETLLQEIGAMPKLRTYKEIKLTPGTEGYVSSKMERYQRALVSKLRLGTLPINIELGRYKHQPVEERKCPNCPEEIEDEKHFLLSCPLYREERRVLYQTFHEKTEIHLDDLTHNEIFFLLLNITKCIKNVSKFIKEALCKRALAQ